MYITRTSTKPAQKTASDGGMAKEWSADPLEIPLGPITRARAKRFKEALNVLIQDSQAEGAHGLNSKKETKLVHVIDECLKHSDYTRVSLAFLC